MPVEVRETLRLSLREFIRQFLTRSLQSPGCWITTIRIVKMKRDKFSVMSNRFEASGSCLLSISDPFLSERARPGSKRGQRHRATFVKRPALKYYRQCLSGQCHHRVEDASVASWRSQTTTLQIQECLLILHIHLPGLMLLKKIQICKGSRDLCPRRRNSNRN